MRLIRLDLPFYLNNLVPILKLIAFPLISSIIG